MKRALETTVNVLKYVQKKCSLFRIAPNSVLTEQLEESHNIHAWLETSWCNERYSISHWTISTVHSLVKFSARLQIVHHIPASVNVLQNYGKHGALPFWMTLLAVCLCVSSNSGISFPTWPTASISDHGQTLWGNLDGPFLLLCCGLGVASECSNACLLLLSLLHV